MRIFGPSATPTPSSSGATRRSSGTSFTLPDAGAASDARQASAPRPAANIDALLALQGIEEDPAERRKRSVQKGRSALDILDDMKVALLAGTYDPATVSRLRTAAADLKQSSGDPGLDAILSDIELRVEVELAKTGHA